MMKLNINEILADVISDMSPTCIALSGGLDSSVVGYHLVDRDVKAVVIIAKDFVGSDLMYSQLAAKSLKMNLEIKNVKTEDILDGISETIKILSNFNDIEIRNAIVSYLMLKDMKKDAVITGDGADELFAGYNFLLEKTDSQLTSDLARIKKIMHFPSVDIGKKLGVKVYTPFLDKRVVEFAETLPNSLKVNTQKDKRYGKWIIRKTYQDKIPKAIAWRQKAAMQDGAGTSGITNMFESVITDEKFRKDKKEILESDGIIIRSKESLHYYDIYRKFHKKPSDISNGKYKCPYCQYGAMDITKFCKICGAFPI